MKKATILLAILLAAQLGVRAQQVITFCGGDALSATGSVSYSCGEVAVKKGVDRSITVVDITQFFTEGIQQAYETKDLDIHTPLDITLSVYPNPTTSSVFVECKDVDVTLYFELYDTKGQQLKSGTYNSGELMNINLDDMGTGTYLFHIHNREKSQSNIYRIVKIK